MKATETITELLAVLNKEYESIEDYYADNKMHLAITALEYAKSCLEELENGEY